MKVLSILLMSLVPRGTPHIIPDKIVARQPSLIPSSPPTAFPTPSPPLRVDARKQSKNVHDFFRLYGWLEENTNIPDNELPRAIRKIQRTLRTPETGVYDKHMDDVMNRPKCGTIQAYNESDASTNEPLSKRYVLWGAKWNHSPLTYRFINYTADLPVERQQTLISAAFSRWTDLLPLSIVPAPPNTARADIHIRFMSMGPNETMYAFTNMIADGLTMSSGLINVTFNDDYPWSDDRLFNFTAVHEIGHALGLSHSKVEEAVMFAYFDGFIRPLHPDDKAAIHKVYGWKEPRWTRIDANAKTKDIMQVSSINDTPSSTNGLYQLRTGGQVLFYSSATGSWTTVDNNKDTVQVTGAGSLLYQRHADGSTYRYTGSGTSWQQIGAASDNVLEIVAAADQIYQRRKDGWTARWSGSGMQWSTIQGPNAALSRQIAVTDSKTLWNLLGNGDLMRSSWPHSKNGWEHVDANPQNIAIAVGGEEFYKLQSNGMVVWLDLDMYYWSVIENADSVAIYAEGMFVFSRHRDGSIWRYTGTPGVWEELDEKPGSVGVVGDREGRVWELLGNGEVLRLVS
ncbi:hypothetical protein BS50DRAFT_631645 [Corynespora cassiicola Philippines]|uniref:Peptidase metallopeptidase domain-containing protein n=1 Tax=Corynespora cassiicola Philippines TaxID=1448308 RepID=A0A2T2NW32_CORCC|nr:hypothetical protein BS50DRAFT_631645 [Corynespora cassiicola Philippines]